MIQAWPCALWPEFRGCHVTADVKFCGLTRPEDANYAVSLGAAYVGAIFASGPRLLTHGRAAEVFADVPTEVKRVGVFADQSIDEIAHVAQRLKLGVVQLHGAFDTSRIKSLRRDFRGAIWCVCRVSGSDLPSEAPDMAVASDGLLLDAMVPGTQGGTGVTIPWAPLAEQLAGIRGTAPIILAGGLRPENVAEAIGALAPDVVDVSSGVESAPGVKDHDRMRAFRDAVSHASIGI
jgi:phosphoribosylanthranilate isomerase